jgi:hypothetical protein
MSNRIARRSATAMICELEGIEGALTPAESKSTSTASLRKT